MVGCLLSLTACQGAGVVEAPDLFDELCPAFVEYRMSRDAERDPSDGIAAIDRALAGQPADGFIDALREAVSEAREDRYAELDSFAAANCLED